MRPERPSEVSQASPAPSETALGLADGYCSCVRQRHPDMLVKTQIFKEKLQILGDIWYKVSRPSGCRIMALLQLPKLITRVRFPSPAPIESSLTLLNSATKTKENRPWWPVFLWAGMKQLWGAEIGSPEGDELEALALLIEKYEDEHYPMPPSDSIEAISPEGVPLGRNLHRI